MIDLELFVAMAALIFYFLWRSRIIEPLRPTDCPQNLTYQGCDPVKNCPKGQFCKNVCTPRCLYKPNTYPPENKFLYFGGSIGFYMYFVLIILIWILIKKYYYTPFDRLF